MPTFSGKPHPQDPKELAALKRIAAKCTSYLEVGVRYGDTFVEVGRVMPEGSVLVGVDLPNASWGRKGSESYFRVAVRHLEMEGYDAHMILGDSRDAKVRAEVIKFAPFDLVLLDGDHTLEGITADWEVYGWLGRVVAFHDIVSWQERIKVPELWKRLKAEYPHEEFISRRDDMMGIGVLYRDAEFRRYVTGEVA